MDILFDYYEDIDDPVYITDIDTYDLVYMNTCLREKLGYTDLNFVRGKKCYDILYKADFPCNFCKHEELKRSKYVQYICDDPKLKRRYLVRNKLVECDGKKYKVTVTTEVDASGHKKIELDRIEQERILNECLRLFFSESDPNEAFQALLKYITCTFQGDRGYIFETNENKEYVDNTYEWCSENVKPQIHILQKVPYSDLDYWITAFHNKEPIILEEVEEIKYVYPHTYSILKPQNIYALVVAPIQENGHLKGFIGIDNPSLDNMNMTESILRQLGIYMNVQLSRRNLYQMFNKMSYKDTLTGAFNQNAMLGAKLLTNDKDSFGAVYCDLNGLKRTNDLHGHDEGNRLICECYNLMKKCLRTEWIYRVGGDEFIALYENVPREFVEQDVDSLRMTSLQSTCSVSVGMAWSDKHPIDENAILKYADSDMYREKNLYYSVQTSGEKKSNNLKSNVISSEELMEHFMHNTYCDVGFLLHAIVRKNFTSHFFFGDIQQDIYYVSDNMKDLFGFSSNIVPHLLKKWENVIVDKKSHEQFCKNVREIMCDPTKHHDMRYQVRDKNGKNWWIRCYAEVKWREDGKQPLFFAGRLTQQDSYFIVDTLTNLPNKAVLQDRLHLASKKYESVPLIAFSFNSIESLNTRLGRDFTDSFIADICDQLSMLFEEGNLFRISGMRFAAIVTQERQADIQMLIEKIKKVIHDKYNKVDSMMRDPCTIVSLNYPVQNVKPNDFTDYLITFLKSLQQNEDSVYNITSADAMQKIHKRKQYAGKIHEDVRNAMENFRIVIQPVVDAEKGCVKAGEVLLRWKYNETDISPVDFIPLLEDKSLIDTAGRWVLTQACHACARIITFIPDFYLTVNVSLQQLNDKELIDHIKKELEENQLDGSHLVLELTESTMDTKSKQLEVFIQNCTKLNVRIALDDFGTGFSSMRVLMQYPSAIVKLDRSLLLEMENSEKNIDFVTSIVNACHQVEKKVCIEGVETNEQDFLAKKQNVIIYRAFSITNQWS